MNQQHEDWCGLADGPFPKVSVYGDLERADIEWLHTNGAGAYAMSTIALMHTRRTHGMLVAALDPPLSRYVMLGHGESSLEAEGKVHRLSTHQFPNIAPTPGYRLLEYFAQDPIPRWLFRVGASRFERTLALVRGHNAVVLRYLWQGSGTARLSIRPLLPLRPVDTLTREHGGMVQRVSLRTGVVEIQPRKELPPLLFRYGGVFVGSPDWWRRFEYVEDRRAGMDFIEDMWTPGTFELTLEPDRPTYLMAAVGQLPDGAPAELLEETRRFELSQDPGPERPFAVRALSVAAEQFCATTAPRPTIIAGWPWLDAIHRDTLVAMPGLLLARNRLDDAKRVMTTVLDCMRDGVLQFKMPLTNGQPQGPSPDATLWLLEAIAAIVDVAGTSDAFVADVLYPVAAGIVERMTRGEMPGMWLTKDGLVANGVAGQALTWMDAKQGNDAVTARRGLAVEHQALWAKGADLVAHLADAYGDGSRRTVASEAAALARESFGERFWCNETEYPFDCISETTDAATAWADATVRPNAVIALAVDPASFEFWQAAATVGRAREDLVVSRGLRSLASYEPGYRGHYEGDPWELDGAYHQGTAWTHLLGFFVRAAVRLSPDDEELRDELRACVEAALLRGPVLGQVSQLADGEYPHRARGCLAQAWSVAELLRALSVDLRL